MAAKKSRANNLEYKRLNILFLIVEWQAVDTFIVVVYLKTEQKEIRKI